MNIGGAVVDRYCWDFKQVGAHTISEVFVTGKFHNMASRGFQEGYYATSSETAEERAIVEMCGHAVYIGRK